METSFSGAMSCLLLSAVLLVVVTPTSGALTRAPQWSANMAPSATALAGCQVGCGNLTFSYPFGVGPGCFRDGDFELNCVDGHPHPRLFLRDGTTQVVTAVGEERVGVALFSQNISMAPGVDVYTVPWRAPGRAFALEHAALKAIGCDFDAYFEAQSIGSTPALLCSVTCPGPGTSQGEEEIMDAVAGHNCNGTGCCTIILDATFRDFQLRFVRHGQTSNNSAPPLSNRSTLRDRIVLTTDSASLKWTIPDQPTCASALDSRTNYACVGRNSNCIDRFPLGYLCRCDLGYTGNPYVLQGCSRDRGYNPIQWSRNCERLCGNISVPFPFGLEEGCSARNQFKLSCTDDALQFGDYNNVTSININEGLVDIRHMVQEGEHQQFMSPGEGKLPDLFDNPREYSILRFMVWAVANLTCVEAQYNISEYACLSVNSTCVGVHSSDGYLGYRCKCLVGFDGNPYIQNGCKGNPYIHNGCLDVDECVLPGICHGICHNTVGAYKCAACPNGTTFDSIEMRCIATRKEYTRLVIGIYACVFSALTALLGIQVIVHRRSVKRQLLMRKRDEYFQQHGGQLLSDMMKIERNLAFTLYRREDIEEATNNFDAKNIIGEGGQGTVYMGTVDNTRVAIKRCKVVDESRRMEFGQEVLILCRVSHDNIVKLLGCCLLFQVPILVYEFVPNKTLHDLLHHPQAERRRGITLGTRLRIAAECAEALGHLHSLVHPILHGDVKTANILLGENFVAKVADFGCSIIARMDEEALVAKGTIGYLDPEYLQSCKLTDKSDVYSFGVVVLELLTRMKPRCLASMFQEAMKEGTLVDDLVDTEIVDEDDMEVIHQAAELASHCLEMPGEKRPTMKHVGQELRRLAGLARQRPEDVVHGHLLSEAAQLTSWSSTMDPSDCTQRRNTEYYSLEKNATLSLESTGLAR